MNNNSTKKYQVVKQEIKSWILSGRLKVGEQIATEKEQASSFGVSRQTVRQAIGELVNEGHLYRVQGKGTFVNQWSEESGGNGGDQNIAVITTRLFDYIFPNIIQGAEEVLRKNNYGLLLSSTDNNMDKERECLEALLAKPLKGIIVEPTRSAVPNKNLDYYLTFEERGIPVVMTNSNYPQLGAPTLMIDDEKGSFLAVEHLVKLGHKRIGGIFQREVLTGVRRMGGFINALRYFGLPIINYMIGNYTMDEKNEKPSQFIQTMLNRPSPERPSALVCFNDEIALQALEEIRRMGLKVPDDLSIVGFDDSTFATATEIKLTTIAHPKEAMGRRAAEMLVEMIRNKTTYTDNVVFEPKLIVRNSTRPADNN